MKIDQSDYIEFAAYLEKGLLQEKYGGCKPCNCGGGCYGITEDITKAKEGKDLAELVQKG